MPNPVSTLSRSARVALAVAFAIPVAMVLAAMPAAHAADAGSQQSKPKVKRLEAKKVKEARDAVRPKVDATLQQLMKMSEPGPEHKALEVLAGSWSAKGRAFTTPDADPWPIEGTMVSRFILGGRYLESEWQGHIQKQKFWGRGLEGYDNVKKKHFSQWIDSMNTGISLSEGESSEDGRIRTMYSEVPDPETGQMVKQKSVTRVRGYNSYSFETSFVGEDGKETKMMEILFTREAAADEKPRQEGSR